MLKTAMQLKRERQIERLRAVKETTEDSSSSSITLPPQFLKYIPKHVKSIQPEGTDTSYSTNVAIDFIDRIDEITSSIEIVLDPSPPSALEQVHFLMIYI